MSKQCALAAQRARHGTAPPLGKGRDCPICSMCLLTWDNLWLSDSKVLRYVRRCYPFNNLVEENRAGNLLCCFPSYLARLSTLILLLTSYGPYLHCHSICEPSDHFCLSHVLSPSPPLTSSICMCLSISLWNYFQALSVFLRSHLPKIKTSVIKPLLTESDSNSNICFPFPDSCQFSDLNWHWLSVGQIWWLLHVPPGYLVDVKSGSLGSLSATWPTRVLCNLFALWAIDSIFISPLSLTLIVCSWKRCRLQVYTRCH